MELSLKRNKGLLIKVAIVASLFFISYGLDLWTNLSKEQRPATVMSKLVTAADKESK